MLIKNANIHGREGIWDIKIENGKFSKIGNALTADNGEEIIDASGKMVIPPYVDSHVHLDYVCTYGEPRYNMSGTLFEGISIWSERKKTLTKADVKNGPAMSLTGKLPMEHSLSEPMSIVMNPDMFQQKHFWNCVMK